MSETNWFSEAWDSISALGDKVGDSLGDVWDAGVEAVTDSIKRSGDSSPATAVPQTHAAVPTGVNADGSTVLPTAKQPTAQAGVPQWVVYGGAGLAVLVVGAVIVSLVKD